MDYNKTTKFKEKIKDECVFGIFSKTSDPAFIEALGYADYDFVIIDMEHGPNNIYNAQNLVRAAQVADIIPIIRTKEDNKSNIGEALDIGAAGVQIPQIISKESAESVISKSKFAPVGERGVCICVRGADYSSKDRYEYFNDANNSIVILQLEGEAAINNIESIIQVKGIDVIFIGPYDLSQSLGVSGMVEHPLVVESMNKIVNICKKEDIVVGTYVDNIDNAKRWIEAGVKYIAYSVDTRIFYESCRDILKTIKI